MVREPARVALSRARQPVQVRRIDAIRIYDHQAPDPEPAEVLDQEHADAAATDDPDSEVVQNRLSGVAEQTCLPVEPHGRRRGLAPGTWPVPHDPAADDCGMSQR